MRVIAGKYRHRILIWPDDAKHIRPTKDRIREAIFGALGNIEGKCVLDLYLFILELSKCSFGRIFSL